MTCRGVCIRYKAGKPSFGQGRYETGQKRCQICELFLQWDGLMCPCCSYRLRARPRNMKSKARLLSNNINGQVNSKIPTTPILVSSFREIANKTIRTSS